MSEDKGYDSVAKTITIQHQCPQGKNLVSSMIELRNILPSLSRSKNKVPLKKLICDDFGMKTFKYLELPSKTLIKMFEILYLPNDSFDLFQSLLLWVLDKHKNVEKYNTRSSKRSRGEGTTTIVSRIWEIVVNLTTKG